MRKYDSYKDSGIEWIGEIPSHWETKRIRHIADIFGRIGYRGYTVEDIVFDETGAISLSPSNIENQKLTLESVTRITEEKYKESPEIMVYENDVVLVKTASVGKAAIVRPLNDLATINPQLVVFKNYRIDQTFFYYEIISRIIQDQITQDLNGGVVNTITQTNLNNYSIIVPQPQEQTAIAAYLDRKTAEIDELIAYKKRLLELYEEEKTAIINQAVTKGINPDVPMKDSGIDGGDLRWLGEIPEHWEVKRLKMIVSKIGSGVTPSGGSTVYLTSGIPLLRSQNIHFDGLRLDDVAFISDEIDEGMSNSRIQDGDVLLNITGASIGRCYYVPNGFGKGNVNQHVCIIRPFLDKVDTNFLYYIIRSEIGQTQIKLQQTGANREGLNFEQLKNFGFPVPESIEEQQSIVRHIETECALIDAKKAKTEQLIKLLTEYRTALISEVVTGKVKVI